MELYRYSKKEDLFNAYSHLVGFVISFVGMSYLSYLSENTTELVSVFIYSLTLMFMFLASFSYHLIWNDKARLFLKKLDHSAIYLLITGTYIPYTFIALKTTGGYIIIGLLIILTIIGILFKFSHVGKFKKLSTIIYVMMGWAVVFQGYNIYISIPHISFWLLLLGGIVYSIGAIMYACCNFKYHHFIWHLFVLMAAILHFASIVTLLVRT